ncbi:MAG: hypothetical protein NVS4B7_03280 [Ktedonobacteraceae bacterium]
MNSQIRTTMRLNSEPPSQLSHVRRPGRFLIPIGTFSIGLIFGIIGVMLYLLSISGNGHILATPLPPQSKDILIQIGPIYINHLVEKDLREAGMDYVSNVQVTLATGDQLTIDGDDQIFLGVTRHFTIVVQPTIENCQLNMHVLHADLAGITITGFVANFEGQIDQQLQNSLSSLPKGFTYCKTSVRTDSQGLYITYSAKPS